MILKSGNNKPFPALDVSRLGAVAADIGRKFPAFQPPEINSPGRVAA
jgi:hypothetical protein